MLVIISLGFIGCSSAPSQPLNNNGGYSSIQLNQDTYIQHKVRAPLRRFSKGFVTTKPVFHTTCKAANELE